MEEILEFRYLSVTADSGYESEEAYSYLREKQQTPYIKPQTYEKWKTVYECEDCTGCAYKCTRAKGNKRLYVSKSFLEKRQESYANFKGSRQISVGRLTRICRK